MPELPPAATDLVEAINHPGHLADLIAANVAVPIEEKQAVLETVALKARMMLVLETLNRKREILTLAKAIEAKVKGELSKAQREAYLREQLKTIQEMLGQPAQPTPRACSFCGNTESQVKKLITGPAVSVCNECILRFSGML